MGYGPMTAFERALGLARSLIVYHGIPGRQRRMRRLYASFVDAGDLAFDIGAHAGNRTRALASLGCRVVAVEPQPDFARLLRRMFARSPAVTIVESAVGGAPGRATLAVSDRTPTVTTLSESWRDARRADADFAGVQWNRSVGVPVTTLDRLIAEHGMPAFVKIDVEGSEADVLAGLTHPVPAVSFEYLPRALDLVAACTARLAELGDYRFTWSPGESFRLVMQARLRGPELLESLRAPAAQQQSGDVYAVLSIDAGAGRAEARFR
jgi:FkbM family methyltransferase